MARTRRRKRAAGAPPGSIYRNGKRFWWLVRLPGESARHARPLIPAGRLAADDAGILRVVPSPGGTRFAASDRAVAEQIAWDLWREAVERAARDPDAGPVTIAVLVERYLDYARTYYRNPDGEPTGEADNLALAVAPLVDRWPTLPAAEFDVGQLLEVRDALVAGRWPEDAPVRGDDEPRGLARSTVNSRVASIRRMFDWAGGEARLVPPAMAQCLHLVKPLRAHRSRARETPRVRPVADWVVEATLTHTTGVIAAMVRVQRLTSMRSGELCPMRPTDLDRRRDVWIYAVRQHKGRHRQADTDEPKLVALGPQAQGVLEPLLADRAPGAYVFSPAESEAERHARRREARQTPVQPSQVDRRSADPQRRPGRVYTPRSYCQAIRHAVRAANRARRAEAAEAGRDTWVRVPHWHPHQLRHSAATEITESADLTAASAVLGHETIEMTAEYARDAVRRIRLARAIDAARQLG